MHEPGSASPLADSDTTSRAYLPPSAARACEHEAHAVLLAPGVDGIWYERWIGARLARSAQVQDAPSVASPRSCARSTRRFDPRARYDTRR
jgi:hypothetical protein